MTHELLLLRHAKSDWSVEMDDFSRPLKKRGRRAAKQVGRWLYEQRLIPDAILCSPAMRALSTAQRVCKQLDIDESAITFNPHIYEANASTLLEILRANDRILKYPMSSEALALIQTFNPQDKFVRFTNDGGNKNFQLRETPYKCFQLARQYAQADGFDIRIGSGYRSVGTQSAAFNRSDRSGKMVAAPGRSWHQSGGAGNYQLVKNGQVLSSTKGRADRATGSKKEANDRLESYMNKAGFVRYEVEAWHFEVGSVGWLKIMAQNGAVSKDYADGNGAYKRYQA